jgi:hypothetical protein
VRFLSQAEGVQRCRGEKSILPETILTLTAAMAHVVDDERIHFDYHLLDADPYLLGLQNGVFDSEAENSGSEEVGSKISTPPQAAPSVLPPGHQQQARIPGSLAQQDIIKFFGKTGGQRMLEILGFVPPKKRRARKTRYEADETTLQPGDKGYVRRGG